jgi:predicted nucleic acid-binding protein
MRRVLDSCIAFKWHVAEKDTAKALQIRADFLRGNVELLAPDFFTIEFAHSITKAERQGRITPAEGAIHLQDMLATLPDLHPHLPLLPRAYEISSQTGQGVYDCLYVALAEREGCELLTSDEKLIRKLQPIFPFITGLATLP